MNRIAFIAHLSELSGSGTSLVETAAAMNSRGFESFLIVPGNGPLVRRATDLGLEPIVVDNPETAVTSGGLSQKWTTLRSRIRFVGELRKFLRNQNIDLACINSTANIFPAIACRLENVRIVWRVHESLETKDAKTRFKTWIVRRISDGIVYDSETGMKNLPHPAAKPGLVARNYIKVHEFQSLGREKLFTETAVQMDGKPIIFSNGTIRRKGVDILLRALPSILERFPTLNPVAQICGLPQADPDFMKDLDGIIEQSNLKSSVEFAGLHNSLGPLLREAAIFVSASRNEALPIAIVEAIASGVPVIATDVGDCANLLENGKLGWIIPTEDPEALAAAVIEVLTRPEIAKSKAVAAYHKIDKLYADEDFWQPMESFLRNISNNKNAPPML